MVLIRANALVFRLKFLDAVRDWFAVWSTVEVSLFVELIFHAFNPVAGASAGDVIDATAQFALSFLCVTPFLIAHMIVDVDAMLWTNVERRENGSVEAESHGTAKNRV